MPKPVMHGAEKSDPRVVPMKPANKAGQPAAESAEGSGGTERNARLQITVRTQSREAVSRAQRGAWPILSFKRPSIGVCPIK